VCFYPLSPLPSSKKQKQPDLSFKDNCKSQSKMFRLAQPAPLTSLRPAGLQEADRWRRLLTDWGFCWAGKRQCVCFPLAVVLRRKETSKIKRIPGRLRKIPTSLHLSGFISKCRRVFQSFAKQPFTKNEQTCSTFKAANPKRDSEPEFPSTG
jgi:hypothetical protein